MSKRKNEGQILIAVVSLLSIAIATVAVAISLGFLDIFRYASYDASHKAFYGAESGLQEGLLELSLNRSYRGESLNLGGADITVAVETTGFGRYVVKSLGKSGGSARNLELEVRDVSGRLQVVEWREVY